MAASTINSKFNIGDMINSVGGTAYKFSFIRTIPGGYYTAATNINNVLGISEKSNNHQIYKSIGISDVLIVSKSDSFIDYDKLDLPTPGILNKKSILSFLYHPQNYSFTNILEFKYILIVAFKLNNEHHPPFVAIQESTQSLLLQSNDILILGTFGPDELIFLKLSEEFKELVKFANVINSDYFCNHNCFSNLNFCLGINHNYAPMLGKIEGKLKQFIDASNNLNPDLAKLKIACDLENLKLSIKVVPIRSSYEMVIEFFSKNNFLLDPTISDGSLSFTSSENLSLSSFLAIEEYFKFKYKDKILKSHIDITFLMPENKHNKEDSIKKTPQLGLKENQLKTLEIDLNSNLYNRDSLFLFGRYISNINYLMWNNPRKDHFNDLYDYPSYIDSVQKALKDAGMDNKERFVTVSTEMIKLAIENRSYEYKLYNEEVLNISPVNIGCQILIQAFEAIPQIIYNNFGSYWRGFVVTGREDVFSVNESIHIPIHILLNPDSWWKIFPEIGRTFIYKIPELTPNQPVISKFLESFVDAYEVFDLLIDYAAESISFELFFFRDFELYFNLLWKNFHKNYIGAKYLEALILKSFFIKILHSNNYKDARSLQKSNLSDLDLLFSTIVDYIGDIEKCIRISIEDKFFIAAKNLTFFRDIWPFATYLSDLSGKYNLKPKPNKLKLKNTLNIIEYFKFGKIWNNKIISPEAVLYHLLKAENLSQNSRISTIITFWNYWWRLRLENH